ATKSQPQSGGNPATTEPTPVDPRQWSVQFVTTHSSWLGSRPPIHEELPNDDPQHVSGFLAVVRNKMGGVTVAFDERSGNAAVSELMARWERENDSERREAGCITPGMLVELHNDSGALKWGVHDSANDPVARAI